MRRVKKWGTVLLAFLLFSTVLLSGCWDSRELEQRTSVVAMAIDLVKSEKSGIYLAKVSVQIPIPIKIAGAGGGSSGEGGRKAVKVMSATGRSVADALRRLQQRLNQELFYGHTRVIAVSADVASRDMEGIIDSLRRTPQMRRLLWLLITPGEAIKLLQADPKLEQIPIVYVMDLIENGSKQGRIPDVTLGHWFIDRSTTGVEPIANLMMSKGEEVKWEGLALFHGDHMVGSISESDSWVLMNLKKNQVGGNITIPSPVHLQGFGGTCYITVHPKKVKTKTRVVPEGDHFHMSSKVQLEVDVTETMCNLNYADEHLFREVEKAIRVEMNTRAKQMIQNVQSKYKVDALGLGTIVRAHYLDRFLAIKDWDETFQKSTIDIEYEVMIRRVGMKMS